MHKKHTKEMSEDGISKEHGMLKGNQGKLVDEMRKIHSGKERYR